MVRERLPEMRDAMFAGHAGNDGSAIAWGQALGARLADLGGYQGHGSWAVPQGALVTWALMTEGGIQVNARGERFHDETRLLGSLGAGAGPARRHRVERLRRPPARARPHLSRLRRRRGARGAVRHATDEAGARRGSSAAKPRRCSRPPGEAPASGAVPRIQGHRRALPHPGRPRHRRRLPRAARRRHADAEPARRRRRGARRLGQRGLGLSLRQRPAERRGRRLHRRAHARQEELLA